jgi:predicted Zn-dependent protease with MMP-like domain
MSAESLSAPSPVPSLLSPEGKIWFSLIGSASLILLLVWISADAAGYVKTLSLHRRRRRPSSSSEFDWSALKSRAEKIISETVAALPNVVKKETGNIPCLFHKWSPELRGGGALAAYVGFEDGVVSQSGGPIILFLGNLNEYCRRKNLDFDEEVRRTYLHELGHHLGWDEAELRRRGLI